MTYRFTAGLLGLLTLAVAEPPLQLALPEPFKPESIQSRYVCGLPLLTPEKVAQAVENTRLNQPAVYAAMIRQAVRKAQTDTVGDTVRFYVYNLEKEEFDRVTAVLKAGGDASQGEISAVWVAVEEWDNQHVTQTEVDRIFEVLESSTPSGSWAPDSGAIALVHQYFGLPPDKDSDGISDFLLVDIQDGWKTGDDSFVAGFFLPTDQTNEPSSNRRDILYIDTYPGIYRHQNDRSVENALSVLSHEYQHLVHYRYDKNEASWINEGLSELSSAVCGFLLRNPAHYLEDPDNPLLHWAGDLADYAQVALFTLYYSEQLGRSVLKKIVAETRRGKAGLDQVMTEINAGYDFDRLFKNFTIANYVNDLYLGSEYGYHYFEILNPTPEYSFLDPNQESRADTVAGYAVDYIEYPSFSNLLEVDFTLPAGTVAVYAFLFGRESKSVEEVSGGSTYSVDAGVQDVVSLTLAVINTEVVEKAYSFTSQGEPGSDYSNYEELAYDDGEPNIFCCGAAYLGFSNNRQGSGWAVQFVPQHPTNRLHEARIFAVFSQEFQGSTIPSTAPKDFTFHVWETQSGFPGQDLVTPFLVSTKRTRFPRDFMTVELGDYATQLSDLDTVFIGFIENDSLSTSVGMDSTTRKNHTFAFRGPTYETSGWAPMSNLEAGSGSEKVSLAGWNMMMRAVFEYFDETRLIFSAGYFQNPVFTEELDLFILGSTTLSPAKLSAYLTHDSRADTLRVRTLPQSGDSILICDQVTLSSSGPIAFQIRGTSQYGRTITDTTFNYELSHIQSSRGGTLSSQELGLVLTIPGGALEKNSYIMAGRGISDPQVAGLLPERYGEAFTISPVGYSLKTPARLKLKLPPETIAAGDNKLILKTWREDRWEALPSGLSPDGGYLQAEIHSLGHFALTPWDQSLEVSPEFIPREFALYDNYPNPFNPVTTIQYDLPRAGPVSLRIYNLLGGEVRTLVNGRQPAGHYALEWNGRNAAGQAVGSGIYFYRLVAGDFSATKKLVLAR